MLIVAALTACTSAAATKGEPTPPARVERVKGTKLRRIVLSARAVQRLGLETVAVAAAQDGSELTVLPYVSVIYDPGGQTWAYATIARRTYQRTPITVDRIVGDRAYLSAGPPVGTRVVSIGTAEVYGTEFFSDHE